MLLRIFVQMRPLVLIANNTVGQAGPQGAERTPWKPHCRESAMISAGFKPTSSNAT